jgi:DNA-3-methyladenine glycosylase
VAADVVKDSTAKTEYPVSSLGPVRRLRRAELPPDTATLARYLIGKILVHDRPRERIAGRIVETEAYVVGDAAAHAFRGRTPRNNSLFLERGHAYVYFVYGCWFALNVSAESPGIGAGVLLRALEPLEGLGSMQRHRETQRLLDLARGPGRLAMAMDVDRRFDGVDLCAPGPLWLGASRQRPREVGESVRIGITREVERKLRFFERDNAFVSGPSRMRA